MRVTGKECSRFAFLFSGMLLFLGTAFAAEQKGKFIGAMPTEYPAWFKQSFLDFNDDIREAAANGKRLMVLFHQDGCPYCNVLVERNLAQRDIEQAIRKNLDVVAINMWGDREVASVEGKTYTEKSFAAALKVQFTPTILFFNEEGKMILRLNGYVPPERFKVAIDFVTGKHEKQMAYRDYVEKHLAPGKSGDLIRQSFFAEKPYNLAQVKGKQPFALFFEQKDCPNCETLHKQVLVDEETRDVIKNFHTVQLDMWSDTPVVGPDGNKTTARDLAKQLDVKYAPTIVIFNKDGKEIIRSEAFFKIFHTQGLFDYVLSESYIKQPSFQRYLSDRAHDIQAQGKDVDIWSLADDEEKPSGKK